jgi:hypothetical protein
MINEIKTTSNEGILDTETLKKVFAGNGTPCHCDRCGTSENDAAHNANRAI